MKIRIEVDVEIPSWTETPTLDSIKNLIVEPLESEGYFIVSLSASNGSEYFSARSKDAKDT